MRILCAIVEPAPSFLPIQVTNDLHGSAIWPKFVGGDRFRFAISLHWFSKEIQRFFSVPALGDKAFQHFARMVNRPPKVVCLTIDLHENFVQAPLPVRICAHSARALSTDFRREHRAKSIPPEPNCFVTDVDPALVWQVFEISK